MSIKAKNSNSKKQTSSERFKIPFRQVHLDFHTSQLIEGIGREFDKKKWQETLQKARVNSVTCFSKCHHGYSYHETKIGKKHPHMKGELLQKQIEANLEIGVNTPVYLSAGVDNLASYEHPEWREIDLEGKYTGWVKSPIKAGFHKLCFNSPYLDYLCDQITETTKLFPEASAIWLDIIAQNQCCCKWCLEVMEENGLDPLKEEDRIKCSMITLKKYYDRTTEAVRNVDPTKPSFHNSGHIQRGNREVLSYFKHLELESLPTGGWGYDHFPISARYCVNLPYDFLGMTGKFHTTWGEFGGYKHPNALRYECAVMLANGAKCSVGDQLHPEGILDESTYEIIGRAYSEVEEKEPWCDNIETVADIAVLSNMSISDPEGLGTEGMDNAADTGAGRILFEGHFLFDMIDSEMDFEKYKAIILPDSINVERQLEEKLQAHIGNGGKLILSGTSALDSENNRFIFDIGADWFGASQYEHDFILPEAKLRANFVNSPIVMYLFSQRIKATNGKSLGEVYDPYFNRTYKHFCSHQHAPAKSKMSGYDCGTINKAGNVMYFAHPVFSLYRGIGSVALKDYVVNAIKNFIGKKMVDVNLPSVGRVTMMKQPQKDRYILHLLYANTVTRGGKMKMSGGTLTGESQSVEIIEDIVPLYDINVEVQPEAKVKSVTLQPQGKAIEFSESDSIIQFKVEKLLCHQMIELKY